VSEPQETPTLSDDDIETRPAGSISAYATDDTSDTGDDTGDTGDDTGDTSDTTDTGDDSGDTTDTGDDS
jgi:hypothetical protein